MKWIYIYSLRYFLKLLRYIVFIKIWNSLKQQAMQFFARHGSVKSSIKALTSSLPFATINIVIVDIN
jgi:hypothetical protein